ncbi:hypothetical protein MIND_01114000 [Mycena indigotica]|uniref:Uncharacterized protein n=1 Tax=Mycena indigotica TaxID=2126181 RepID=A0A8H6VTI2_9AGAR|nr:uncharacterized protein MIND_01114000 [Mycena indigotica]KAF7293372.1 hypothetical protein MIND_01114000 [Mycena indigotica]
MVLRHEMDSDITYSLQFQLSGHFGAVLCLGCRHDGKYLGSGGTDGTKIWDLKSRREMQVPASSTIRGAMTCLVWLKRDDDTAEALIFGTQSGYLVCWIDEMDKDTGKAVFKEVWCCQLTEPAEITGLAFDLMTNRLAACHRGGILQIYTLRGATIRHEVCSFKIPNCTPQAVMFGSMFGNERELMLFGLHCGLVYTVRGNLPPSVENAWNLGCHIGGVALDVANSVLCINDPSTSVDSYGFRDRERLKSFRSTNNEVATCSPGVFGRQFHHGRERKRPWDRLHLGAASW